MYAAPTIENEMASNKEKKLTKKFHMQNRQFFRLVNGKWEIPIQKNACGKIIVCCSQLTLYFKCLSVSVCVHHYDIFHIRRIEGGRRGYAMLYMLQKARQ